MMGAMQDTGRPSEVEARLLRIQFEALDPARRQKISETDFKENKAGYVSSALLQDLRLVNQQGTQESKISLQEKKKLTAWNTVYADIEDDGTNTEKLGDVNEGLGQTHRIRLLQDQSVRDYSGEEEDHRGGHGRRSRRSGLGDGRGGGNIGRAAARDRKVPFASESGTRKAQPITRTRVVKGQHIPSKDDLLRQAVAQAKESLSTKRKLKKVDGASQSSETPKHQKINFGGTLASPDSFMSFIRVGSASVPTKPSNTSAVLAQESKGLPSSTLTEEVKKPNVGVKPSISSSSRDIMDLEVEQDSSIQPVLNFTHSAAKPTQPTTMSSNTNTKASNPIIQHLEAIESSGLASGLLNAEQLDLLRSIRVQVQIVKDPEPIMTPEPAAELATVKAPVSTSNPISVTSSTPPLTSPSGIATVSEKTPSKTPKIIERRGRSLAQKLADQRAVLIGEHIYKTRFQPAEAALSEEFGKLSLSDQKATTEAPIATSNPFGPAKSNSSKKRILSLPPHLVGQEPVADSGVTARAQNSRLDTSKPTLPPHLVSQAPPTDTGAAARAQYLGHDISSKPSLPPHLVHQAAPHAAPTDHGAAARAQYLEHDVSSKPTLPPHLIRQAASTDHEAAARAQYAGSGVTSRPSLPPHLARQAAPIDHGAAARAQYANPNVTSKPALPPHLLNQAAAPTDSGAASRDVLAPVSNSQQRSVSTPVQPAPSATPTPPAAPTARQSKINSTGFVKLAAQRNADDPLTLARKRGP